VIGATAIVRSAINLGGEITGNYEDAANVFHGFVRYTDGSVTTFDASGSGRGAGEGTTPQNINSVGQIVGYYYHSHAVAHWPSLQMLR
jgi:hypothetical protein